GGDRSALRALYETQAARLLGLAVRITGQPSLAADAVHDTFVQVWENAERYDPGRGSVEAWLTGLLRFRAIDTLRSRARDVAAEAAPELTDPDPGPMERLLSTAEGASLYRCLDRLEPRQRQVITLAYVQGLSHGDLALRLATPLGTVKSWIRRGLASLRGCLEA
ncbi:MAG: sigma-70 family RNA polymerase sigma factor, partial [Rhodospirillales bacterium]|nr:sigma-70 family RNA polymerase sigma factor [Rhodospirillales bacterium]